MYRAGIDVGSTTVKLCVLDSDNKPVFGRYMRHCAHIQETLAGLLKEAEKELGDISVIVGITGSGSINLGKALGIQFIQEVAAVASALELSAPQTDVAIELAARTLKSFISAAGLTSA